MAEMENFAEREEVPVVLFRKGERKDDIAGEHLKRVTKPEGVKLRTETTSNNTRLRDRQATQEPPGLAADRLQSQPTCSGRRDDFS